MAVMGAVSLVVVAIHAAPAAAAAALPPVEVEMRLEAKGHDGAVHKFADGTERLLERWTVLRTADFTRAVASPTLNQNAPGMYEVDLLYTRPAAARFIALGDADRERSYCLLLDGIIEHCAAFPPEQKAIYDRGDRLMADRTPAAARDLAGRINRAIGAQRGERRRVEQAARRGPRALLALLYRRSRANHEPLWIDGEERTGFLSDSLQALWDKVDAAQRAGNHDEIYDADPIAATNGLSLGSFRISVGQLTPTHAEADVLVGYAEPAPTQTVRYVLVRERGGWRIDDIGNRDWSLRRALAAFAGATVPTRP
jgi:hypothetical protein